MKLSKKHKDIKKAAQAFIQQRTEEGKSTAINDIAEDLRIKLTRIHLNKGERVARLYETEKGYEATIEAKEDSFLLEEDYVAYAQHVLAYCIAIVQLELYEPFFAISLNTTHVPYQVKGSDGEWKPKDCSHNAALFYAQVLLDTVKT